METPNIKDTLEGLQGWQRVVAIIAIVCAVVVGLFMYFNSQEPVQEAAPLPTNSINIGGSTQNTDVNQK